MECALKLKIRLLKCLLVTHIIGFISIIGVFFWLSFKFPVILNNTTVTVQCSEIKIEDKMFAFAIKSYVPDCMIGFKVDYWYLAIINSDVLASNDQVFRIKPCIMFMRLWNYGRNYSIDNYCFASKSTIYQQRVDSKTFICPQFTLSPMSHSIRHFLCLISSAINQRRNEQFICCPQFQGSCKGWLFLDSNPSMLAKSMTNVRMSRSSRGGARDRRTP